MPCFKSRKRRIACFFMALALWINVTVPATAVSLSPIQIPADKLPVLEQLKPTMSEAISGHRVCTVRRYASADALVIGCMEDGVKLTVLGTSGEYYQIDCFDMKGYIAKSQVTVDEAGQYYVNCKSGSADTKMLASQNAQDAMSTRSSIRSLAIAQEGVPYVWGGTTPRGFDCSGFTQYVYRNAGWTIHRSVAQQLQDGIIIAKKDLQCGDLVFFENTTGAGHFASHIGIYLGNGKLIHAGSRGITIVDLESSYFVNHYLCSRRVVLTDLATSVTQPITGLTPHVGGILGTTPGLINPR